MALFAIPLIVSGIGVANVNFAIFTITELATTIIDEHFASYDSTDAKLKDTQGKIYRNRGTDPPFNL